MKGKRYTEEQIIGVLNQHESGVTVESICRDMGIAQGTFYRWKSKYGGMDVSDAKRLRELESENGKLKRLLAEAALDNAALKEIVSKKW